MASKKRLWFWWKRHKHEDYFMTDEEWRFEQFYQRNKKQFEEFANALAHGSNSGIKFEDIAF